MVNNPNAPMWKYGRHGPGNGKHVPRAVLFALAVAGALAAAAAVTAGLPATVF